MRKLIAVIFVFTLTMTGAHQTPALDVSGYLNNKISVADEENFSGENKLDLDLHLKNEGYYLFTSCQVINQYGETDTANLELNKAYISLYPQWSRITIGKQVVSWGNSYLFSLVDVFNPIDIMDPKGERTGVNGIDLKTDINTTTQFEIAAFPTAKLSDGDYGAAFRTSLGLFVFGVNVLHNTEPDGATKQRNSYVLDIKGELGKSGLGIWGQWGEIQDSSFDETKTRYYNTVIGGDYTFSLGEGLYVLAEFLQNNKEEGKKGYLHIKYSPESSLSIEGNVLRDLTHNQDLVYYSTIDCNLNDRIALSCSYYYCPSGSSAILEAQETEFYRKWLFKITTNF